MRILDCFRAPVIPVLWDPRPHADALSYASMAILQGGAIADLPQTLDALSLPEFQHLAVFVHIDLIAGLENSEAGLEYLRGFDRVQGIVSVHHYLARPARKAGLLSITRVFISDSRAVDRGVNVVQKSKPDAVEILPAAVAIKVGPKFEKCPVPRIAGGLCTTESDVRETLASGCRAVSCTDPKLWELNRTHQA
ncbi:Glycerol-3-phosphate responsive antiterminator [Posidoniimonas polymericola]|uniref:Glycerol-3-phosphate responsive antiterminator n=1 Tax=Posidoniimonas polymericola TaxID=2528002 RepID=A0A5C5YTA6_9BACT|nr:glycerol-3-phosphate responsive antiterminator [Posidoniimonas polymericola]TWT78232.1 Glycerol-3-phosphate responsive antiterminator [Posidoniimonas polymericola]